MTEVERIFKALANRRRLAIVRHLKARREASVGELAQLLKVSFPATSKHLAILSAADLVEREQRSLQTFYRLADSPARFTRSILNLL